MKEAKSNEMDLLLRSLASRRGALTIPGDGAGDDGLGSDHLDADELNSYAEGAAPEAARARYTKHLADCDACRGIVVGLTQAAGTVTNYERPELPRGLTFWQKLAALFSQPVWRYAVPAVILTGVIGIGLFALRPRSNNDFVAQNQAPGPQPAERQAGAVSTGSPNPTQNVYDSITPHPTPDLTRGSLDGRKGATTTGEEVPAAASAPKAVPEKDSKAAGEVATESERKPSDTFQSKTAAPAPPPGTDSSYDKSASLAKEQPAKREDQDRDEIYRGQQQQDDVHGPNRARNNNTFPQSNQQTALPMGGRGGPSNQVANKKTSEPEVRTVMGRHFTRDGGAWIDTAYESQATIKVARGSDQYRALVADEPGIRTIAENLDGVVIVIWKGHAYRIQ
jgi:hypothetical protein